MVSSAQLSLPKGSAPRCGDRGAPAEPSRHSKLCGAGCSKTCVCGSVALGNIKAGMKIETCDVVLAVMRYGIREITQRMERCERR